MYKMKKNTEKRHTITIDDSTYQRLKRLPYSRTEGAILMLLTKYAGYDYSDSNSILAEYVGMSYPEVYEFPFTNDLYRCYRYIIPKLQMEGYTFTLIALRTNGYIARIESVLNDIVITGIKATPEAATCEALMEYIKLKFPILYAKRIEPMWR